MQTRTVKFVDFWPTFDCHDNLFVKTLRTMFDVVVLDSDSPEAADILFYSRCESANHLNYKDCLKIYYTGENDFPDFNSCDYALSFYPYSCGGRHFRLPIWMMYEVEQAQNPLQLSDAKALSREFCSALIRNVSNCDPRRLEIINAVESYKPLAYGGAFRNNVGGCVENKIEFIGHYKFNLALENSIADGYVTEKLLEPFAATTVPIYWGDAYALREFNPEGFINVRDYDSIYSFVRALQRIDETPEEYLKLLRQPVFKSDIPSDMQGRLAEFLCGIASDMVIKRPLYGEVDTLYKRNLLTVPVWWNKNGRHVQKIIARIPGLRCFGNGRGNW